MYEELLKDPTIIKYLENADRCVRSFGFTEHGIAHSMKVGETAKVILDLLHKDSSLAKVTGLLHDIGNSINRQDHAISGAVLAHSILLSKGVLVDDILKIITAIGNHDESSCNICDELTAAIVIADKIDIRRTRVKKWDMNTLDIHDRVNYAVIDSVVTVNNNVIEVKFMLDPEYARVCDFYSIYGSRVKLCNKAARVLGCKFELVVEEVKN